MVEGSLVCKYRKLVVNVCFAQVLPSWAGVGKRSDDRRYRGIVAVPCRSMLQSPSLVVWRSLYIAVVTTLMV